MIVNNLLMSKKDRVIIFVISLTLAFMISLLINLADAEVSFIAEGQVSISSQVSESDIVEVLNSHATTFVLYATTAFAIGLPSNYVLEEMQKLAEELGSDSKVKKVEILVVKNTTQIPKINITKYFQKKVSTGTSKKKALKEVKSVVRKLRFPDYAIIFKKVF